MTTKSIVFLSNRKPVPQRIFIGFETDNRVERLEFALPSLHDQQTATLMLGGKYANMVSLTFAENRYRVEITAEIVGAPGEIDAYVTINTPDGRVWNSMPFVLVVGDLPNIDSDIQHYFPDAIEQMRQEISQHRMDMGEEIDAVNEAADRAESAAQEVTDILDGGAEGQILSKQDGKPVWVDPAFSGGGGLTELPVASADKLGGVMVGENLAIDENGRLSVDTTDGVSEDNTRPITSAGVYVVVGNIEALLKTI